MDEATMKLLFDNNLMKYADVFQEEQIDICALKLLRPEHFRELGITEAESALLTFGAWKPFRTCCKRKDSTTLTFTMDRKKHCGQI